MSEADRFDDERPPLECLDGKPAPAKLLRDWRRFQRLPEKARDSIWEVVAPVLTSPPNDEALRQAVAFSQLHGVAAAELEAAIDVCRFLAVESARKNLSPERFEADLARLSGEDRSGVSVLLAGYPAAAAHVRREVLEGSLFDHGRVLTGVDWRIDQVVASDRGSDLHFPAVVLSLRYREGHGPAAKDDKVTLHLVPDALTGLRKTCERIEAILRPPADAPRAQPAETVTGSVDEAEE